jgi:hypothetical protein
MGLTVQVSNLSEGKCFFSSPQCPGWLWGSLSLLFIVYWSSSLWVKWPGYDVDRSFLFSAEVENDCNYTSTPLVSVHAMERDSFAFTMYL